MNSPDSGIKEDQPESLDAIRHADPISEETTSTTKSSSEDTCCCTVLGRRISRQLEDVYTLCVAATRRASPKPPKIKKIPKLRFFAPTPPPESPETSRLAELRRKRMERYRENQLWQEISLDPLPRNSYITITRYSVHLSGFPMTQPEVTYSWLIDSCSEFLGYRAVYSSPRNREEVYVEFSGLEQARCAAIALHGKQITKTRVLNAHVAKLPMNAIFVAIKETQV